MMLLRFRSLVATAATLSCLVTVPLPVAACGWWGDAVGGDSAGSITIGADGEIQAAVDPLENPELMVAYGDRFRIGKEVPRDYNVALRWYRLAAHRGYAGGQYSLARMLEYGLGTPVDLAEAARWYRLAAEQGEMHSQHHLADLYRDGRGVPADPVESTRWLRASAEQGHVEVFADMAVAYATGFGIGADETLAYQWWWLARDAGFTNAPAALEELAARLTPEQVADAERGGRAWLGRWALPSAWGVPDLKK